MNAFPQPLFLDGFPFDFLNHRFWGCPMLTQSSAFLFVSEALVADDEANALGLLQHKGEKTATEA